MIGYIKLSNGIIYKSIKYAEYEIDKIYEIPKLDFSFCEMPLDVGYGGDNDIYVEVMILGETKHNIETHRSYTKLV